MALSVDVPKNLSVVKNKVALGMTKRQLICYPIGIVIGVPAYFLTKGVLGGTMAALIMIVLNLPFFLMAHFERDGKPAEKVVADMVRHKFLRPEFRPYKTQDLYGTLARMQKIEEEVRSIESGR